MSDNNNRLTSAQRYKKANPDPYHNQESYNDYMAKMEASNASKLQHERYFDLRTPQEIADEIQRQRTSIPIPAETRKRMLENSKKEDYELWPLQFPEKLLLNEFNKHISKGGHELIYNDIVNIFNMIKENNQGLEPKQQLDKAVEYIRQLAQFCSTLPEWSWEYKRRYLIRGFLTREAYINELTNADVGTFIICIRDEPVVGLMIASRMFMDTNNDVIFIKVDHDKDGTFSIVEDKYRSLSECILNFSPPLRKVQVSQMGTRVDYKELLKEKGILQSQQSSSYAVNRWKDFNIPASANNKKGGRRTLRKQRKLRNKRTLHKRH
jgi:hypothetical protein